MFSYSSICGRSINSSKVNCVFSAKFVDTKLRVGNKVGVLYTVLKWSLFTTVWHITCRFEKWRFSNKYGQSLNSIIRIRLFWAYKIIGRDINNLENISCNHVWTEKWNLVHEMICKTNYLSKLSLLIDFILLKTANTNHLLHVFLYKKHTYKTCIKVYIKPANLSIIVVFTVR